VNKNAIERLKMPKTIPRLFVDSIKIQFAQELRRRLDENGIKYRFVAERCNMSPVYLNKILKGEDFPSTAAIQEIAKILRLTPHELLMNIKFPNNLADWIEVEQGE
jgi:transcriptional regulator with XRE-family HTH domain